MESSTSASFTGKAQEPYEKAFTRYFDVFRRLPTSNTLLARDLEDGALLGCVCTSQNPK